MADEQRIAGRAAGAALPRRSFRRRLLVTLGAALAVVFLVLGVLSWFAYYGWLTYQARAQLRQEAQGIASLIVSPGGRLRLQRYTGHEPHHRYADRRIDPFFVQVFDAGGTLLHTSDNIKALAPGAYPDALLTRESTRLTSLESLNTVRVGGALLYFDVLPLRRGDGPLLGYVQVSRYEPGIAATLRRFTLLLLGSLGLLLAGLLMLTRRIAQRVLQPLEAITQATEAISPQGLHRRIPVPAEADRETHQLAATLNTLLDRLESSFEEMQRFTANAAHELQTPLTVLRGHVEVALRRPRPAEAYQETLRLLAGEVDDMTRMVHGLLVLARLDRDHYTLNDASVDLAAVAQEAAATFEAPATAKNLAFYVHTPEAVWIAGQPDLLREVVINLIDNAVKYTPSGSVTVRLETRDEQAVLSVADTGIGIAPESLPHVTDRFYRAASMQSAEIAGHGLGLSLAARIVALHGGRLQIHSTPGQGTTAEVSFPLMNFDD